MNTEGYGWGHFVAARPTSASMVPARKARGSPHMSHTRRISITGSVLLLAVVLATPITAKPGNGGGGGGGGGGGSPSVAVVSLGDSYISGEAGRWAGNSLTNSGNRGGTDRAAYRKKGQWYYDASLVYLQGTDSDGCHRSDVADIHSTGQNVASINLACSGAVTANIPRASQGGQSQKGWAPQADQLAAVSANTDIAMVVLSIGGNDLGFSDIILDCVTEWFTSPSWWENHCNGEQQDNVDARMPAAMNGVRNAIDEIKAVMAARGDSDYRLVLRSYASPIPRGSENRYPESGWSRWDDGGCPTWNEDANWARDSLVPQIAANLAVVASEKGVEFLDMQDALEDHEVCSIHAGHGPGNNGAGAEWVRWVNTGWNQGEAQESAHPNAYGQRQAGACLGAMFAAGPGNYSCTSPAGATPESVTLVPT